LTFFTSVRASVVSPPFSGSAPAIAAEAVTHIAAAVSSPATANTEACLLARSAPRVELTISDSFLVGLPNGKLRVKN